MRLPFIALFVGLLAVIGLELWPHARPIAPDPAAAPASAPSLASAAAANTEGRIDGLVTTILARPLFTPSRRPAGRDAGPVAARPVALPRLTGIVVDGQRRAAIFEAPAGRRSLVVPVGGQVDGFRVESIEAAGVVLAGDGQRRALRPSFDPSAVPLTPPVPIPAPVLAPPANLGAFNGPPGLGTMPKAPAPTPGALPGLPGLQGLNGDISGIPGLTPPVTR